MGGYIKTPVSLTESQLKKLKSGHPVTLRINPSKQPNHELYLTQTQVNSLNKAKSNGVSKDIKLSKSQTIVNQINSTQKLKLIKKNKTEKKYKTYFSLYKLSPSSILLFLNTVELHFFLNILVFSSS